MDIILDAKTDIQEMSIDFVELETEKGLVTIDWDETCKQGDGERFHMRGEQIYLNGNRPDAQTWDILENASLSAVQVYAPKASWKEKEQIVITGLSFMDQTKMLTFDVSDAHPRKKSFCEDNIGKEMQLTF